MNTNQSVKVSVGFLLSLLKQASLPYLHASLLCLATFFAAISHAQTWHLPAQDDVSGAGLSATTNYYSVFFTSDTKGWAVGDGSIITTKDGGSNWTSQLSNQPYSLYSVCFANSSSGWAVGDNGAILNTSNGGLNWTWQTLPGSPFLNSVCYNNVTSLHVAVGQSGAIYTSADGTSWTPRTSGSTNDLYSVASIGNLTCAVGMFGTIVRSSDGISWSVSNVGSNDLYSVFFISQSQGCAVGQGGIIMTTFDGGVTWTQRSSPTPYDLNSVYFVSTTQGWAVGNNGTILRTSDGGVTWTSQSQGTSSYWGVHFSSAIHGCMVGLSGAELLYNCLSASASLATGNQSQTQDAARTTYYGNSSCSNYIAKLIPNGVSPVSGNITSKVWIESTQSAGYVRRHYEITPATNATSATGRVTLYFTQQDFDNFNALNTVKLPTNSADATNKANLLIEKRSGTSNNGTGLPASYTASAITIDPADANIVWNGSASRWEVTIDVTGFSGFFVKTSTFILPVHLMSFTANRQGAGNLLQWTTSSETNSNQFDLERGDGRVFEKIGQVKAAGNTNVMQHYSFEDRTPVSTASFYRLKMTDKDGKFEYSNIVRVKNGALITVYPNPAGDKLFITGINSTVNYQVKNYAGQVVREGRLQNNESINLAGLAPGLYILSANGQNEKFMKQ